MPLLLETSFWDGVWWILEVFFLMLALWLFVSIFADIFRRDDLSGLGKAGWIIFVIVLPFLGVFIYLITQNDSMMKRNMDRAKAQRAQMDDYVRQTAGGGGAAAEIERAKALLDSGAISQAEFDALKQKALS